MSLYESWLDLVVEDLGAGMYWRLRVRPSEVGDLVQRCEEKVIGLKQITRHGRDFVAWGRADGSGGRDAIELALSGFPPVKTADRFQDL